MILLFYFLILFIIYYKFKSVATILIVLQVISLSLMFLVDKDYPIDTLFKLFNFFFIALILTIVIAPWKNFSKIEEIYSPDEHKVAKLTRVLLIICLFMFITLLIVSIIVTIRYSDRINYLRSEFEFEDFLYHQLPFNVKFYLLSYYLYPLSYFLIPLHFYYLGKQKSRLAILCFIMSLNIILFGLTYFSRSPIIHYLFIYSTFFFLFKDTLSKKIKRNMGIVLFILIALLSYRFIFISESRFEKDISYQNLIPVYSKIQDPVLYNYVDYASQWYNNSMIVLDNYNTETLNGQYTFGTVLGILGQYGLVDYNFDRYLNLRQKLMGDKWDKFNGLVAAWIFDFGYLLTFLLALCYNYIIRKLKPHNKRLSLNNLFVLVLLIQIPLSAIFYSVLGGIVIAFLLWIPINLYLRVNMSMRKK